MFPLEGGVNVGRRDGDGLYLAAQTDLHGHGLLLLVLLLQALMVTLKKEIFPVYSLLEFRRSAATDSRRTFTKGLGWNGVIQGDSVCLWLRVGGRICQIGQLLRELASYRECAMHVVC